MRGSPRGRGGWQPYGGAYGGYSEEYYGGGGENTHTHLPVHSSPLSMYIDYYQGDYSGRGYGYGGGRGGKQLSVCGCVCVLSHVLRLWRSLTLRTNEGKLPWSRSRGGTKGLSSIWTLISFC